VKIRKEYTIQSGLHCCVYVGTLAGAKQHATRVFGPTAAVTITRAPTLNLVHYAATRREGKKWV
jgi:hypothetical protein